MTTTAVRSDASRWRLRHLAVCAMLAAFAINSSAGRLVSETKVDLTVDPFAFLGRALHLWDPQGFSGQVQNQAYGYLFPIGPFFALGHAIGAPGWVVQRLWWAALLITAYTGVVALARRLRIGTPFSAAMPRPSRRCVPRCCLPGSRSSCSGWAWPVPPVAATP